MERPATLPPRSARRLWGDEQKESKEAIDNTQLRGHASGNLNPASHTTARKQNGKSQTFSGLAMGRMNSLGFLTAPDEAIGSSPRSGRNRFASFSGVPGLGGSGSLFRTRINSASTSPIETSTPRPLSEKHATPGALLRAASGSMRSALSSFKILGSANRRIPMSLFEKMDDENHGLRCFRTPC